MARARTAGIVLISLSLWASGACAELTVIYDSGVTRPLARYLEVFGEAPRMDPPARIETSNANLGAATVPNLLPIRTPGLTPGPVTPRPLRLPNNGTLSRPFFLIGSDARSREWFAKHRDRLQAIGAVGMLVQAETEADLAAIAQIADGIPILPASATDIARALGLEHIPALVSRHGIEQ
ncbi:MAG: integrating conjugative element protein [Pseudomonadales bacterium]|jgi:integrating conjugative element protein (TIGR03765 family)|nr:integrating conjugative element protein [Pseudomonadales bacterium]